MERSSGDGEEWLITVVTERTSSEPRSDQKGWKTGSHKMGGNQLVINEMNKTSI